MNIAFFISDHGYGHIMRNLPVMKELTKRGHNIVVVCGKRHIEIAREYLEEAVYIEFHTDAGLVVKPGTLIVDKEATASAVNGYVSEFPERISLAKSIIKEYSIGAVVADIVPWALLVAKQLSIPSFLMASFTWIEQYESFVNDEDLNVLREAFQTTEQVLYYDLVNKPTSDLLGSGIDVGFVAREFQVDEVIRIKSEHKRPIVFISLGGSNSGLNFEIDVSSLPYDFISTCALKLKGTNVTYLDASVPNSQDYVKAADFCIAKAGWSTVSEMMLAGVKFGVLTRPDVPEDTMIIEELGKRQAAIAINVEELKDMGKVMDKLEKYDFSQICYENNYKKIASIVTRIEL